MKLTLLILIVIFLFIAPSYGQEFINDPNKVEYVFWSSDKEKCSICDQATIDGITYRAFRTADFDLVLIATVDKKLIYAGVSIENKSNERIEFNPKYSILAVSKEIGDKNPSEYGSISPEEAAKKVKGNNFLKNFLTGMAAGAATQQSDVQTNGSVTDNKGNTVDFKADSTIKTQNEDAQRRASEIVSERNRNAKNKEISVLSSALRANTIFPKGDIIGTIYFPKKKGAFFYIGIRVKDKLYLSAYTFPK